MHVLLALLASAAAFSPTPPLASRRASGVPSTFGRSTADGPCTSATALTMSTIDEIEETFVRGSSDPLMKLCADEEACEEGGMFDGSTADGPSTGAMALTIDEIEKSFVLGSNDPLMKLCAEEERASLELQVEEQVRGVTRSAAVKRRVIVRALLSAVVCALRAFLSRWGFEIGEGKD